MSSSLIMDGINSFGGLFCALLMGFLKEREKFGCRGCDLDIMYIKASTWEKFSKYIWRPPWYPWNWLLSLLP
jgi:hypothetical protein